MQVIPVQAVPSQTFNVVLDSQNCTISLYAKTTGVYLDLFVSNTLIIGGVLCLDRNLIVRSAYLGFIGDIFFVDQQGTSDPVYTDFGTRFLLVYALPSELVNG